MTHSLMQSAGWLASSPLSLGSRGLQGTGNTAGQFSWDAIGEREQVSPPVPSQGAGFSICHF